MTSLLDVTAPIATVSEANNREHWAVKAGRVARQRQGIVAYLMAEARWPWKREQVWTALRATGLVVTLTRIAPRSLDDDNLRGALKAIRDGVTDWLGLKSDSAPGLAWRYEQARGRAGVRVRIEVAAAVCPTCGHELATQGTQTAREVLGG